MKLSETATMMNSDDYKERFRAEYFQLVNRIGKFSKILDDYRHEKLKFEPKCSIKLYDGQMNAMILYKTHLEETAKIEGISLEEVVEQEVENETADKIKTDNKQEPRK